QLIDEEISLLLSEAIERAKEILHENMEKLERIVCVLLEKETIEKNEFEELMA
ncbi:MAG: hypothetical protein COY02_01575, partial [Parcubacteria group bacterium CG_4_10_14_0_2_um_filter_41_6]